MLDKAGHGKSVDWYLLGVLIYEMLTGIPPFFVEDWDLLFHWIWNEEPDIPDVSVEAQDLLKWLLCKDPLKRLGSGKSDAEEIKSHPWFSHLDWNMVIRKQYKLVDVKILDNLGNMKKKYNQNDEDQENVDSFVEEDDKR